MGWIYITWDSAIDCSHAKNEAKASSSVSYRALSAGVFKSVQILWPEVQSPECKYCSNKQPNGQQVFPNGRVSSAATATTALTTLPH